MLDSENGSLLYRIGACEHCSNSVMLRGVLLFGFAVPGDLRPVGDDCDLLAEPINGKTPRPTKAHSFMWQIETAPRGNQQSKQLSTAVAND